MHLLYVCSAGLQPGDLREQGLEDALVLLDEVIAGPDLDVHADVQHALLKRAAQHASLDFRDVRSRPVDVEAARHIKARLLGRISLWSRDMLLDRLKQSVDAGVMAC